MTIETREATGSPPAGLEGRPFVRTLVALSLPLVGLLMAAWVATDFGISTDEPINYQVGRDALKAQVRELGYLDYARHGETLAHHGPSYFMVFAGGARLLVEVFPGWHLADGRHFINILTFLGGVGAFFLLARRFMKLGPAWMATAFFASQPLLLGHGFINQKDTPFMVFFLASVVVGLAAVDRLAQVGGGGPEGSAYARLAAEWRRADRKWKGIAWGVLTVAGLMAVEFLFLEQGLRWGRQLVARAYEGRAWEPVNRLFLAVAEDAGSAPVEAYLLKVSWGYWHLRFLALGLLITLLLVVGPRLLPTAFGRPGRARWSSAGWVLLAGALFGFTVSIRPIAGFVGLLVSLYWLRRRRAEGVGLLLIYWMAAGAVMYITWPYLWEAPVSRLIKSLLFASEFNRPTVYLGEYLYSNELPWHYVPVLASVQLTEPTLPLFLVGLVASIRRTARRALPALDLLLLLLWVGVPISALLAFKLGVYGNIRQLLFLLPPYLVVAGIGIETLLRPLRTRGLRWGGFGLLLAPALIGIVRLHPYEYSYFNRYVGGMAGAARLFTLDRWCTSYRETMQYVNAVAKPGDHVTALQAPLAARAFARDDIEVGLEYERPPEGADYLLTCSFFLGGYQWREDWVEVHTVGRAGVVFAEVYQYRPPDGNP